MQAPSGDRRACGSNASVKLRFIEGPSESAFAAIEDKWRRVAPGLAIDDGAGLRR
jgi:hypothetical protein